MRRTIRAIAATALTVVVLGVSGVGWYAFSTPPEQHLTLGANLIDAGSAEGMRLLADSSANVDYGQLLPYFVSQSRRGFCGVATASMIVNAALPRPEPLTQAKLFATDLAGLRANLAVTFGGMTLDQLAALLRSHGPAVQAVHASASSVFFWRNRRTTRPSASRLGSIRVLCRSASKPPSASCRPRHATGGRTAGRSRAGTSTRPVGTATESGTRPMPARPRR